ncbi:MAG TPA: hypothetical protein PLN69_02355 [bacterium]|nr:hypothetical protein [bacterium]
MPKITLKDIFQEIENSYKTPVMILLGAFILFTALLIIANTSLPFSEVPIQYRIHDDVHYLSTTKGLYAFNDYGTIEWELHEVDRVPLEGKLEFDIDTEGRIYLTNTGRHRVDVFTPGGTLSFSFGAEELSGNFIIKILDNKNILISDIFNHNLKLYDKDGVFIKTIGERGSDDMQFNFPNGLEQMPDGTVLVAETNNLRIQRFEPEMDSNISPHWSLLDASNPDSRSQSLIHTVFRPINWEHYFWPTRMLCDPVHSQIYIGFFDDFVTPDGFVAVYDEEGGLRRMADLIMPSGLRVDAHNMQLAPRGLVSFLDYDAFIAGLWNPETDSIEPPPGSGISSTLNRLRRKTSVLLWIKGIGQGGLIFCFIPFTALMVYAQFMLAESRVRDLNIRTGDKPVRMAKNRFVAVLLSILVPGLGDVYLGNIVRGTILMSFFIFLCCPLYGQYANLYEVMYIPFQLWFEIHMVHINILIGMSLFILYTASIIFVVTGWKQQNNRVAKPRSRE